MKIKEISYALGYTIPDPRPGSYGNAKPMVSAKAELDEGENPSEALMVLKEIVTKRLDDNAKEIKARFIKG